MHITLEKVIADLRRAVAEKGADYVYVDPNGKVAGSPYALGADCVNYDAKGQPSCVVGHVLQYWTDEGLIQKQGEAFPYCANSNAYEAFREIRDNCGVIVDDGGAELATRVQILQDKGETWGLALEGGLYGLENQTDPHQLADLKELAES